VTLTTTLGIAFVALALTSTFLMFQFWGYGYDKERRKSECPQWKMNIHRGVGYAYAIVYLIMMWHMVPRLWQYQIELPARTVAHILLALSIGVILLLKISILRWFRHFEEWMPALGVALLLCSVLLVGLSLPAAIKAGSIDNVAFDRANRERVRGLLEGAGYPAEVDLDALTSERSLREGRRVLLGECVFCHDLQTAIARPRTAKDWLRTVERMADKPSLGPVLDDPEIYAVAAYLVAITPDLQKSARAKRAEAEERRESMRALEEMVQPGQGDAGTAEPGPGDEPRAGGEPTAGVAPGAAAQPGAAAEPGASRQPPEAPAALDPARARAAFDRVCSECHPASDTAEEPPTSKRAVDALIARMIDNGMEASKADLRLVRAHLIATYAR
jgi:mono/diheme cytochrome c family protein